MGVAGGCDDRGVIAPRLLLRLKYFLGSHVACIPFKGFSCWVVMPFWHVHAGFQWVAACVCVCVLACERSPENFQVVAAMLMQVLQKLNGMVCE